MIHTALFLSAGNFVLYYQEVEDYGVYQSV